MKKAIYLPILLFAALLTVLAAGCTGITLLEPADRASVSMMRTDWQELLEERKAIVVKPGEVLEYKDNKGFPVPVHFQWKSDVQPPYILEIARDRNFNRIDRTITTRTSEADVYNLENGRNYFWRVRAGNAASAMASFQTADTGFRQIFVAATGPVNVRDWGGKRMNDGRRTRQGILFRGTQMQNPFELTGEARNVMLNDLGIRTDLDLRYDGDTAKMTESPLGPSVQWLHYAINAYNAFQPQNRSTQFPLWRDTFRVFADEANFPVYFHCFGGVDRTGEVALLLNFLLDVNEEQAFTDYELSSLAHFPRAITIPYLQEWMQNIATFAPEGASRQQQAEAFLLAIGLTSEEIDAIRHNLTE